VVEKIQAEVDETTEILESFGLDADASGAAVARLRERPKAWVDFMMRFELGLEDPAPRRALTSAVTIAGAYVVGGLIPLAPYMAVSTARAAVPLSVVVTLAALAVFGYVKGRFTGTRPVRSAWQTALIGGIAAAAAFAIAKYIM